eukprot:c5488_g1_i1.p1 GENE.c5488_g1_i1~~c5488_g1_i1.p1  ORF type:complete len:200 (+),score=86.95 c5488_g1_i1:97-696(+)
MSSKSKSDSEKKGKKLSKPRFSLKAVKREFRVLMVGLEGGGKTTLLHRMKTNTFQSTFPTIGYNVEMVWASKKGIHITVWDVGGGKHIRSLWQYYVNDKQGIIYVVDASDRSRMNEARDTLHDLLKEYALRDAVLLVMATKKNLSGAMNHEEIYQGLNLDAVKHREKYVQMCDNQTNEGVIEGLDWLSVQAHATADMYH